MEFEGKVWKDGKFWLIEIPALNVMTQCKTKKEVLGMAQDAVLGLIKCYFESEIDENFSISINNQKNGIIEITSSNTNLLLALKGKRLRIA
jgi:predicted RNase H-like HicB family nuclease